MLNGWSRNSNANLYSLSRQDVPFRVISCFFPLKYKLGQEDYVLEHCLINHPVDYKWQGRRQFNYEAAWQMSVGVKMN